MLHEHDFKNPKLLITEDGSHTLYHEILDETYHSKHGAIQESNHVFINAGFLFYLEKQPENKHINILEVGLGTGLNLLLTLLIAKKNPETNFHYTALEAFPPSGEILKQLNYFEILQEAGADDLFRKIHDSKWSEYVRLLPNFEMKKLHQKLEDFTSVDKFDIVYFDAFAPDIQPELWEKSIFENLYKHMQKNALLVTYCAKGQVRRNMQSAGFKVERLQGPPGKREMLRAEKV